MRPIRVTPIGAVAVSAPIPLDLFAYTCVGIGVAVSAGATLTYKVQHTYDDVFSNSFSAASATWYDHPTITGKTASFDGSYLYPVVAVRLNVTAWTVGTATMTVLQSGPDG